MELKIIVVFLSIFPSCTIWPLSYMQGTWKWTWGPWIFNLHGRAKLWARGWSFFFPLIAEKTAKLSYQFTVLHLSSESLVGEHGRNCCPLHKKTKTTFGFFLFRETPSPNFFLPLICFSGFVDKLFILVGSRNGGCLMSMPSWMIERVWIPKAI